MTSQAGPVLEIDTLSVAFKHRHGLTPVVEKVSLKVGKGEIVAVIGESGSGKTITALSVLGLLPKQARVMEGHIGLSSLNLLDLSSSERRSLLGNRMAFIPQDALRALNPTMRVGDQVGEPLVLHRQGSWAAARQRAVDLLRAVQLDNPEQRAQSYPHEFSGGMQQRAMIAMGLALHPELLIADEPTTALDVTVQAQVISLLKQIRDSQGTSILFISHDLGLVAGFCDRVYVMYAGRIVEEGTAQQIFATPRHPYTISLLAATPSATEKLESLNAIPGSIPQPGEISAGCRFAPRCWKVAEKCADEPSHMDLGAGHRSRCWFADQLP